MRWKPQARRSPIGIDVGGWNIKAVQLSESSRGPRIESVACVTRVTPDAPLDLNELARLCDVLHRRGFSGTDIVLAVPEAQLIQASMELPVRASGISLDAVARTEFARTQKRDAHSFEMAYWDLPAPPRASSATHVMAVACAHGDADALADKFAAVGLEVCALESRSWAVTRACARVYAKSPGIVAILELGRNAAVLVAVYKGVIVYERILEEAALKRCLETLTRDLKLAPDVAECVLTEAGLQKDSQAASRWDWIGEARGSMAGHFDTIAKDLKASIAYIGNQYPDAGIDHLLLCGGGAMVPGAAEQLQSKLGFETRVITPLDAVAADDQIKRDCTPILMTATGLALFSGH